MEPLTNEDLELLRLYQKFSYKAINGLLNPDSSYDINKALQDDDDEKDYSDVGINYSKVNVVKNIETVKNIYLIMNKLYDFVNSQDWSFVRGTNLDEVNNIKNEMYINKVIAATSSTSIAEKDATENAIPVLLNVFGKKDIPYIDVKEALEGNGDKKEILISPFTEVEKIEAVEDKQLKSGKIARVYNLYLKKREFEKLEEAEKTGLYTYIITNSDLVSQKLAKCIEIEKENQKNYDDIRKLEQLLAKSESNLEELESSGTDREIEEEEANIDRINKQLDESKDEAARLYDERKESSEFVTTWKKKVASYLMAECKEIDDEFEVVANVKQEREEKKKKKLAEEIREKEEALNDKSLEDLITTVRKECKDNTNATERLLVDAKSLILKQQNHAKIAESIGTKYSSLNNGFEIKKSAEELNDLVHKITMKVEDLIDNSDKLLLDSKLMEISKVNIQISTLLNYFNNPKSTIGQSKVTRFDEMEIVEENELKRGIAQKILNLRGEAELKKLANDIEIINDKKPIEKFFGIFTGRNKLDECMLEQIDIRQKAIRKTLARKLELAKNYSIHELISEIRMFLLDNEDDELVEEDCKKLQELEDNLRRSFIVSYSKVDEIVESKEGKNLPVDYKKMSKAELYEVETYRFLNKYGYDIEKENNELQYQDTAVNELNRIIEYINTAKIL